MKPILFSLLTLFLLIGLIPLPAAAEPVPFNESMPGERNLGQPFTFTMNNVSGTYVHSIYHYTVYDFKEIGTNYTYYSVSWGLWNKTEAGKGKKFIAVWARGWMEGTTYFGWGADRFRLWVWGNQTIEPEPVLMNDLEIGSYIRSTSSSYKKSCSEIITVPADLSVGDNVKSTGRRLPAVIAEIENRKATTERGQLTTERFGWKDEIEYDRMEPGWSAKYDGYILFQVPESAGPADIQVAAGFRNFGTAVWPLTEKEIDQDSPERYLQAEVALMQMERESGIRLPDSVENGRTQG